MTENGSGWLEEAPDDLEHHRFAYRKILFSGRTRYQSVTIVDSAKLGKILVMDGAVQSSQEDEFIYHESLIHPGMITLPDPRRVLIIGGGEGASLREVLRYPSVESVTMVDLDSEVIELAKLHLKEWHRGAFDDPRTKLVFGDGRRFLESTPERYDAAVVDVTDCFEEGPARALFTQEFYRTAKDRLTADGLLIVQGLALGPRDYREHAVLHRTLASVFPVVRSYNTFVPSFWSEWGFLIASKKHDPAVLSPEEVAARLKRRLGDAPHPVYGPLRYYGPRAHQKLFLLPEMLTELIQKNGYVLKDAESGTGVLPTT